MGRIFLLLSVFTLILIGCGSDNRVEVVKLEPICVAEIEPHSDFDEAKSEHWNSWILSSAMWDLLKHTSWPSACYKVLKKFLTKSRIDCIIITLK